MAMNLKVLKHLKGLVRLGVFSTSALLLLGVVAARNARSEAADASLLVGREFAGLGDLVAHGYRVRLNGEEIQVGSTTVNLPTSDVLDRFETLCRQGSRGLDDAVKNPEYVLPGLKSDMDQLGLTGLGIVRTEKRGEGTVACITNPDGSFKGLVERLNAFGQSLDLKDLGKLRYVYTRPTANRGKAQVITVWTEGSFRIGRLFPANSDAPGVDPAGAPRPPHSIRRLSAEVDGVPYGVRLYESDDAPEAVLRFYDEQMGGHGWQAIDEVTKADGTMRAFTREGSDLMVLVNRGQGAGEKTSVSMIELPAGAPARAQIVGQ